MLGRQFKCFNPRPRFPPPVADLLADPSSVGRRHPRRNHPCFPRSHLPDSLYEFYVIDDTIAFRNEIGWFWYRHQWLVHAIPDPLRYAILDGLTEILLLLSATVLAAEPRVIETRPEWALNMASLIEKVFVPGLIVAEDEASAVSASPASTSSSHIVFLCDR
jgi:hypothetical protein